MSYKYKVGEEYESRNQDQIDSLTKAYTERGQFSYDPEADAAYQNYVKAMKDNGQKVMQDTMGKAASMTGGYGNSYATSVGQQVYNDYMSQASAAQADFEDRALARYNAEGDNLLSKLSLLQNQESTDRANWESDYARAWSDAQAKAAYGKYSALEQLLGMEDGEIGEQVDLASRKEIGEEEILKMINATQNGKMNAYFDYLDTMGYDTTNYYKILEGLNMTGILNGTVSKNEEGDMVYTDNSPKATVLGSDYGVQGFSSNFKTGEHFHITQNGGQDLNVKLGKEVENKTILEIAEDISAPSVFMYDGTVYCKAPDSKVFLVEASNNLFINDSGDYNTLVKLF